MTYFVDEECLNYIPNRSRTRAYANLEAWRGCRRAPAVEALLPLLLPGVNSQSTKLRISSILIRPEYQLKYIRPKIASMDWCSRTEVLKICTDSSSNSSSSPLEDGGDYYLILFICSPSLCEGSSLMALVDTKNHSLILNDTLYEIARDDFCTTILACFSERSNPFTFENSSDWIYSDDFGHFLRRAPVGLHSVTVHFLPKQDHPIQRLLVQALCANQTIQTLTIYGGIEHWNSFVAVLQEHPTLHTLELKEVCTLSRRFVEVSTHVVASAKESTVKLLKIRPKFNSVALSELRCRLNIREIELKGPVTDIWVQEDPRHPPPCLVALLNCSTGPVRRVLISNCTLDLEQWGQLREALRPKTESTNRSAPPEQPVTELSLLGCVFYAGVMEDMLDVAGSTVCSLHLSLDGSLFSVSAEIVLTRLLFVPDNDVPLKEVKISGMSLASGQPFLRCLQANKGSNCRIQSLHFDFVKNVEFAFLAQCLLQRTTRVRSLVITSIGYYVDGSDLVEAIRRNGSLLRVKLPRLSKRTNRHGLTKQQLRVVAAFGKRNRFVEQLWKGVAQNAALFLLLLVAAQQAPELMRSRVLKAVQSATGTDDDAAIGPVDNSIRAGGHGRRLRSPST